VSRSIAVLALTISLASCGGGGSASAPFVDATAQAGFAYSHGLLNGARTEAQALGGGVAAGDYDGDGFVDLFAVRGDVGPDLLFRNRGDGTFEEVGAGAGLAGSGARISCGPAFCDYDGDGDLDLFVGGLDGTPVRVLRNDGDGRFTDVTDATRLAGSRRNTFGFAFGDFDGDGDLDAAVTHWVPPELAQAAPGEWLWRNNGDGTFTDVTAAAGLAPVAPGTVDWTFTANFTDLDLDGDLDLLFASDFGTGQVYRNEGDGTFTDVTDRSVITDENGMGAAIGDYDNDGDFDWFVSGVWDPDGVAEGFWGVTGNRLYRNRGDGTFEDATDEAGVRRGFWGWGSVFADFDHDGWLDLFHVNGISFPGDDDAAFERDPSRLFLNRGDGTFRTVDVGDRGQGRGVACFDYDRDGDLDLFVANWSQGPLLLRNEGGAGAWLHVRLRGAAPNTQGVGARVRVTAGGRTQLRELRCGNNFVSQNPVVAWFGLGDATVAERVEVTWPDGGTTVLEDIAVNRLIVVER